jgi:hypothetical protein
MIKETQINEEDLLRLARGKKRDELTPDELKALRQYNAQKKREFDARKRAEREEKRIKERRAKEKQESQLAAEERSANAERIKREREEEVLYFVSGDALVDFPDLTPEEVSHYEKQVNLYLHDFERMPFEAMWKRLSLDMVGRLVLKHFSIEPFQFDPNKQYIVDDQGLHEFTKWDTTLLNLTFEEIEARKKAKADEEAAYKANLKAQEARWKAARRQSWPSKSNPTAPARVISGSTFNQ